MDSYVSFNQLSNFASALNPGPQATNDGAFLGAGSAAFVRLSLPSDARAIAQIQARNMRQLLLRQVSQVGPASLALLDPLQFEASWSQAIAHPPSKKHLVLTAVQNEKIVGFMAWAPASLPAVAPISLEGEGEGPKPEREGKTPAASPLLIEPAQVEILALEVQDWEKPLGHESRLMNAAADLWRKTGVRRVQTWVSAQDYARVRLLEECGFAPGGLRQKLQVGKEKLVQHLWFTDLG